MKPQCDMQTDEELVALALGDVSFFACIVRRYEAPLSRYVRRRSGSSVEEAQDVLQNVFINIYRHLNEFDTSLKFSSWVYRITHHEMISLWRHGRTRQTQPLDFDEDGWKLPADFIDSSTAQTQMERQEVGQCIQAIIDRMSDKYRDVFILRFLEDKDYAELSDILQKPMGSVATLINRAREQFRQEFERRCREYSLGNKKS